MKQGDVLLVVLYATLIHAVPIQVPQNDDQSSSVNTTISADECLISGDVFHRGDAVPSPGPCEECICQPPRIQCTMIKCKTNSGCKMIQQTNHCCPQYKCDCEYNGVTYNNGERLVRPDDPCLVCYCKGGEIMCTSITCYERHDCEPRYVSGMCCPKYDHCPLEPSSGNSIRSVNSTMYGSKREIQPWLLTKAMPITEVPKVKTSKAVTPNGNYPQTLQIREVLPAPPEKPEVERRLTISVVTPSLSSETKRTSTVSIAETQHTDVARSATLQLATEASGDDESSTVTTADYESETSTSDSTDYSSESTGTESVTEPSQDTVTNTDSQVTVEHITLQEIIEEPVTDSYSPSLPEAADKEPMVEVEHITLQEIDEVSTESSEDSNSTLLYDAEEDTPTELLQGGVFDETSDMSSNSTLTNSQVIQSRSANNFTEDELDVTFTTESTPTNFSSSSSEEDQAMEVIDISGENLKNKTDVSTENSTSSESNESESNSTSSSEEQRSASMPFIPDRQKFLQLFSNGSNIATKFGMIKISLDVDPDLSSSSEEIDEAHEVVSNHLTPDLLPPTMLPILTPEDLRTVAELLINETIIPASEDNSTSSTKTILFSEAPNVQNSSQSVVKVSIRLLDESNTSTTQESSESSTTSSNSSTESDSELIEMLLNRSNDSVEDENLSNPISLSTLSPNDKLVHEATTLEPSTTMTNDGYNFENSDLSTISNYFTVINSSKSSERSYNENSATKNLPTIEKFLQQLPPDTDEKALNIVKTFLIKYLQESERNDE